MAQNAPVKRDEGNIGLKMRKRETMGCTMANDQPELDKTLRGRALNVDSPAEITPRDILAQELQLVKVLGLRIVSSFRDMLSMFGIRALEDAALIGRSAMQETCMRVQLRNVLLSLSFLLSPCLSSGKSLELGIVRCQLEDLSGGLSCQIRVDDRSF